MEDVILFVEHDEEATTDKPHCDGCETSAEEVTDKPHCDGCG